MWVDDHEDEACDMEEEHFSSVEEQDIPGLEQSIQDVPEPLASLCEPVVIPPIQPNTLSQHLPPQSNNSSQQHTPSEHIYEGSALTVNSSSVLLYQYKMRHGLTEEALADLLPLIKMHCPTPNRFPSSIFQLKKNFPNIEYPVQLHHFCSACMQSVNASFTNCSNNFCNADFTESLGAISSFIEIPVGNQLTTILESKISRGLS